MCQLIQCRYAVVTNRKWQPNMKCTIIECRCGKTPPATDLVSGHIRYPVIDGKVIRDAGYLEVRSKFCNSRFCSLFELFDK